MTRDGLRTLLARDRAVEHWLREQASAAYDLLKADPSRAVTAKQIRARLALEYQRSGRLGSDGRRHPHGSIHAPL